MNEYANLTTTSLTYDMNIPIPLTLTTDPTTNILVSGSDLVLLNPGVYLINATATFTSTAPDVDCYQPVVFRILDIQSGQVVAESSNASINDEFFGPVATGAIINALTNYVSLNFLVASTSGNIIDFSVQVVKIN